MKILQIGPVRCVRARTAEGNGQYVGPGTDGLGHSIIGLSASLAELGHKIGLMTSRPSLANDGHAALREVLPKEYRPDPWSGVVSSESLRNLESMDRFNRHAVWRARRGAFSWLVCSVSGSARADILTLRMEIHRRAAGQSFPSTHNARREFERSWQIVFSSVATSNALLRCTR